MENVKIQYCINQISEFLAARDIGRLDINELENKFGINKVDILVLLGNSIPYTIKCAVKAYEDKLCDKILINGGIGHSTEILRNEIRKDDIYKFISVENKAEADIIFEIMTKVYKIDSEKIIVENKSTNCGDNAKKAVELLEELNIEYSSMLLVQDPTMQLRTYASFLKYVNPEKVKLINYAPFIPSIDENFKLRNVDINGIWDEQRYLQLIMGEIPRLKDDESGYGPKGKSFIAHVDIPSDIEESYYLLKSMISNEDFYSRC